MGQLNLQEETLAAIRRKKKVYIKNLENLPLSDDMKNQLRENINILSEEERRILDQMKL